MTPAVLLAAAAGALAAAGVTELAAASAGSRRRRRSWSAVAALSRLGRSLGPPAAPDGLEERVAASGTRLSVADVLALRSGAALAGALAALPVAALLPVGSSIPVLAAAAGVGHLAPGVWLARRIRTRGETMSAEFADVVDLVRVATDAGLPVRRALREVGRRHPGLLAGELRRTADQLELGVPRREALHGLRRRVPLPAAAGLHAALDAAERLGTPPSGALRALAADARAERTRALAERAARAAPQVQLVVALVLVPSVLLLVAAALLPAIGV